MPNVSEVVDRKHHKHTHIPRWALNILHRRFFLLFLFLLASLAIYPSASSNYTSYMLFRLVGSVIILLSVYAVSVRPGLIILGLVLAVPRLIQHYLSLRADAGALAVLSICLSFTFDVFVIIVMFRRVYLCDKPSTETIFGALSIYLLIAYCFASVYGMVSTLQPKAFYLDPATNAHSVPDRFDLIYYSFGTMTALGASGIAPASNEVRSLTVIQAILGIFYLAVLIARLMAAYRQRALEQLRQ